MLKTVCLRCNKKIKKGEKCRCKNRNLEYDRFARDKVKKEFYHSKEWSLLTKMCKGFCNGLDIYELFENNKIVKGELSHHIIPVEDSTEQKLNIDNLIYVSHKTHNHIHRVYEKSKEDKLKMQKKLFSFLEKIKK